MKLTVAVTYLESAFVIVDGLDLTVTYVHQEWAVVRKVF